MKLLVGDWKYSYFSYFRLSVSCRVVLSDRDKELVSRCLTSAEGGWEDFIDLYLPLILHVVSSCSRLRNGGVPDQLRDDIVAEILLSIIDHDFAILRRFRGQSSLGTYLVVVSRRIAMRALARQARARRARPLGNSAASQPAQEDFAIDDAEEVQALLDKMPGREAAAIRMFHLEHRSYGDIGDSIGIPENSVGPLLSKARLTMRSLRN